METVHAKLARWRRSRPGVDVLEREPDFGQALAQRAEGIVGAAGGLGDGAQVVSSSRLRTTSPWLSRSSSGLPCSFRT